MPATIWHRFKAELIELGLTSSAAPEDLQRWEIRLEGPVLEIKLIDKGGVTAGLVRLIRTGVDDVSFEQKL